VVKFLQSTYSSAVLFQTDSITAIEPPCHRYRHLRLLLFVFSPASSRNPYAHTVSSSRLLKGIEHSLFCSAVGELLMATPRPRLWKCHRCGAGPHVYATTPACTGVPDGIQCGHKLYEGHKLCEECRTDGQIPSTMGTVVLRSPLTAVRTIDFSAMRRTVPAMAPRGNKRALDHQPPLRLGSRPPLAGWWICSNCKSENNPALTDGRCTVCNHRKCSACRPCAR
jgi:hypothetical protein